MPKIEFSAMTIKNLKPGAKSVEYFETGRKSGDGAFGIRVSPKDKKTWFIMYKNQRGAIKRSTIGTYPDMSIKDARGAASDEMAKIRDGIDPMAEKIIRKTAPTMAELWDAYQEDLSLRRRSKVQSTLVEEARKWNKVIKPALGNMRVEDVTPTQIKNLLSRVARKSPISSNRLHSLLRVMLKSALQRGWINIHPLQWIDRPGGAEPPRKRVLDDEEIRKLWPCFDKLKSNPRDILRLILLTAQRPGEIMTMRWEDVDLEANLWTQQDNKTDSAHIVPLSTLVTDILKNRKTERGSCKSEATYGDGEWVFPSLYNRTREGAISDGHTKNTKDARKKLRKHSEIMDWTAHDLRRTARTIMSRLEIKPDIRERVLNHSQHGMVKVYDQYDYLQEKADALEKLGREILGIVGVKTNADNATPKNAI